MTLPNFLIVGAFKSGTTALYSYLLQNPDIYLAADKKESRFLTGLTPEANPKICEFVSVITDYDEYQGLFSSARPGQIIGEVDPWYLYLYPQTIPRILHYLGSSVRIIIILRNPAARCYSHYYQIARQEWPLSPFQQLLEEIPNGREVRWYERMIFDAGKYFKQVEAYLGAFGADQVLVLLYDELLADRENVYERICSFIEINLDFIPDLSMQANVGGIPRSRTMYNLMKKSNPLTRVMKPFMPQTLRKKLRHRLVEMTLRGYPPMTPAAGQVLGVYFQDDISKLANLINKDLSSWQSEAQ